MGLIPENNQEKLEHARRNRAISSAAAMLIVGCFISAILFNLFENSKIIHFWVLVSFTCFLPLYLAIRSWQTEMKRPLPADPNTIQPQNSRVGLKRLNAVICAFGAFFITLFMVGAIFGQAMDGEIKGYPVLTGILPVILPLGIGTMVYRNAMKPKSQDTAGFEVIMKKPDDSRDES